MMERERVEKELTEALELVSWSCFFFIIKKKNKDSDTFFETNFFFSLLLLFLVCYFYSKERKKLKEEQLKHATVRKEQDGIKRAMESMRVQEREDKKKWEIERKGERESFETRLEGVQSKWMAE